MVEKLKSQLDAAHKAKESHDAQKKLQETAKSKQVCKYYTVIVTVIGKQMWLMSKIVEKPYSMTNYNSTFNSSTKSSLWM